MRSAGDNEAERSRDGEREGMEDPGVEDVYQGGESGQGGGSLEGNCDCLRKRRLHCLGGIYGGV